MFNKYKKLKGVTLIDVMYSLPIVALIIIGVVSWYNSAKTRQEIIQTSTGIVRTLDRLESNIANLTDLENTPVRGARGIEDTLNNMVMATEPAYPLLKPKEDSGLGAGYLTAFGGRVDFGFYNVVADGLLEFPSVNLVKARVENLTKTQCFNLVLETAPYMYLTMINNDILKMGPEATEFIVGRTVVNLQDLNDKCVDSNTNKAEFVYYRNPYESKANNNILETLFERQDQVGVRNKYLKKHQFMIEQREIIQSSL